MEKKRWLRKQALSFKPSISQKKKFTLRLLTSNILGCILKMKILHFPLPPSVSTTILLSASMSLMVKGYRISTMQVNKFWRSTIWHST